MEVIRGFPRKAARERWLESDGDELLTAPGEDLGSRPIGVFDAHVSLVAGDPRFLPT